MTGIVWVLICLNCAEPKAKPIEFPTQAACIAYGRDVQQNAGPSVSYDCVIQEDL